MSWLFNSTRSFVAGVWNELVTLQPPDSVPSREWLEEYSDLGIYESVMEEEERFEKCLELNGELVASTVIVDNGELKPTEKSKIRP
jgi:hypothetical protein